MGLYGSDAEPFHQFRASARLTKAKGMIKKNPKAAKAVNTTTRCRIRAALFENCGGELAILINAATVHTQSIEFHHQIALSI